MSTLNRRFLLLLAACCLLALLIGASARATEASNLPAAGAPAGYVVFDRLPWDTKQQSNVNVTRTGQLYKPVYDSAKLTFYAYSTNLKKTDYHGAQGAMTIAQRGAIDFGVNNGVRVLSVAHGFVKEIRGCGELSIRHDNGMVAHYIHMSEIAVKPGQEVHPGTPLGKAGRVCADAAHLHFALWQGNKEVPVAFSNVPAQSSNGYTCPAMVICPSKSNRVQFKYGSASTPPPPPPPTPTPKPPTGPTGPAGYAFCANENQRCNFSGVKDVAYGTGGKYAYRLAVSSGIDCNNATFGDPNYGVVKGCFIKDTPPFSGNVSSTLVITTAEVRLTVCADNLPGRPIYVTLYRGQYNGNPSKLWKPNPVIAGSGQRCMTFGNLDGAYDTFPGVIYYTVASTRPISDGDGQARRTSCYTATGGYQLCDARSR